jgi:hypothetical protein
MDVHSRHGIHNSFKKPKPYGGLAGEDCYRRLLQPGYEIEKHQPQNIYMHFM